MLKSKEVELPIKGKRTFVSDHLIIDSWLVLEPYFKDLLERNFSSLGELKLWLRDKSEFDAVLEEDLAWRYIKMNIDTANNSLSESFNFFINEIAPKIAPFEDLFNKKLIESPFIKDLTDTEYQLLIREIKKEIELFREENISINTLIQTEQQKYGAISSLMTVEINGEEITLQKANNYLKDLDREKREEVFLKIKSRRLADFETLNNLYTQLIELRNKVAINAGFSNFRDYKWLAMGRFDYSVKDAENFHDSIAQELVPLTRAFDANRKRNLNVEMLKPWDMEVDAFGKEPLKPFADGKELLEKTIKCFSRLRPSFGNYLAIMKEMGHLDLESKKGKAPGGFNYPLYETGVPFIYMNAVGSFRDMVTMIHEGGHAIHSFLTRNLELTPFKSFPSEVAELASMGMELISMTHWEVFFEDKEELKRAKREQLEKVLQTLPWVATIDKFQHWVYTHPDHSLEERKVNWLKISEEFGSKLIDWSGNEDLKEATWQKQLHLFEVPFYYIEYGFAQLGAIALWRNYIHNPEKALDAYEAALSLGSTRAIGEVYKAAGVKFDFSPEYVRELVDFVKEELEKLE